MKKKDRKKLFAPDQVEDVCNSKVIGANKPQFNEVDLNENLGFLKEI